MTARIPNWVRKRPWRWAAFGVAAVVVAGLCVPNPQVIPVEGASTHDWNHETFWYAPWGLSGVHRGIDIFAQEGAGVIAATGGLVVYSDEIPVSGNLVIILGPKWRFHMYAHLATRSVSRGEIVKRGEAIGTVGTTGNAKGKPPHLHYEIVSAVPFPWKATREVQGWKKMFYLDPGAALQ